MMIRDSGLLTAGKFKKYGLVGLPHLPVYMA